MKTMIIMSVGILWGMLSRTDMEETGLIGVVAAIAAVLFLIITLVSLALIALRQVFA